MKQREEHGIEILQADEGKLLHKQGWPDDFGVEEIYLSKVDNAENYEEVLIEELVVKEEPAKVETIEEIQKDLDQEGEKVNE